MSRLFSITITAFPWIVLSLLLLGSCISSGAVLPKQLSKTKECDSDGFPDTSKYRSAVNVPGTRHFVPVYSSVDLTQPLQMQSLLVFVHGIGGDANTFFCDALKAVPASVGVVAPWFGDQEVRLKSWAANSTVASGDPTSLFWQGGKWNQGAAAANAPSIASFAALDTILDLVTAKNKDSSGSQLKQVVVVGFSAGAQMVQRYAWATSYGSGSVLPVKFVVSDPSTYLYFDDRRPDAACRPLNDTGSSWSCSTFLAPAAEECKGFNTYKLGLDGLSEGSPYVAQPRIANNPGALSSAYLQKAILYVFGGADTCNCNTKGYVNPGFCIREGDEVSRSCRPSVAGPRCCDMPAGKRTNSFVDVSCGDMLQVGGGSG